MGVAVLNGDGNMSGVDGAQTEGIIKGAGIEAIVTQNQDLRLALNRLPAATPEQATTNTARLAVGNSEIMPASAVPTVAKMEGPPRFMGDNHNVEDATGAQTRTYMGGSLPQSNKSGNTEGEGKKLIGKVFDDHKITDLSITAQNVGITRPEREAVSRTAEKVKAGDETKITLGETLDSEGNTFSDLESSGDEGKGKKSRKDRREIRILARDLAGEFEREMMNWRMVHELRRRTSLRVGVPAVKSLLVHPCTTLYTEEVGGVYYCSEAVYTSKGVKLSLVGL